MNQRLKSILPVSLMSLTLLLATACSQPTVLERYVVMESTVTKQMPEQNQTQKQDRDQLQMQAQAFEAHSRLLEHVRSDVEKKVEELLAKMQVFIPADQPSYKYETLNLPLKNGRDQEVTAFIDAEEALLQSLHGIREKIGQVLAFLQKDFQTENAELKSYLHSFTDKMEKPLSFAELSAEIKKIDEAHLIYVPIYQHELTLRLFRSSVLAQIDEILAVLGVLNAG